MSLSCTYLSSPLCKCAAGKVPSANVRLELGGCINLLGPEVALRLCHVSPGYWTHLSSRKQEVEHRASPFLRALGASLLFSIFILATELFAQTFYTEEKERKNKELLWLKKAVGEESESHLLPSPPCPRGP